MKSNVQGSKSSFPEAEALVAEFVSILQIPAISHEADGTKHWHVRIQMSGRTYDFRIETDASVSVDDKPMFKDLALATARAIAEAMQQ